MVPSVYFSFFSLLVSSVSKFCPDTRRVVVVVTFFMLTCSVVLWGGRNTANKYHWHVGGVLTVFQLHWVCPHYGVCAFPVYTAQALDCSARNCDAGLGLHALPKSKLLRFRFSGTQQRCRLGCACLLSLS